jgi:aldose 1-epimerase
MSLLAAFALLAAAAATQPAGKVSWAPYGHLSDGRVVHQVTLTNGKGMRVRLINYGATITDVDVPDSSGKADNVVLGFANLADYEAKNGDYAFGSAIGRFVGRIGAARFTLDGKEVRLTPNDGPNALHGGPGNFQSKLFEMRPYSGNGLVGAILTYRSPAGEQGFPGTLDVTITYTLTDKDELRIDYQATTDAPTVVNLTNHSYFNLKGAGSGTARDHLLRIAGDKLAETDPRGIPTGRFLPVAGTPFDFRKATRIGDLIDREHPQMEGRRGYNHSWLLANRGGKLALAATLSDPASGRRLDVLTTEPALQIYAGNWMSGRDVGAQGVAYGSHDAIVFETQHFPDSPNHPNFPSTRLAPGETYRSTTVFRFSAGARR